MDTLFYYLCMYIGICIYVCVYERMYMCICVYVCIFIQIRLYMYFCVSVYVYIYIYIYISLLIHYLQLLSFYFLFHCFYCCFLFSFGLFRPKLNNMMCSAIERCYDNIVLSLNGQLQRVHNMHVNNQIYQFSTSCHCQPFYTCNLFYTQINCTFNL